jgi:hypothetical protein
MARQKSKPSIVLTLKKRTGGCCGCKSQVGACGCKEELLLECRQRGALAVLIGYDEFIPSTPPKKYLRVANSGSATSNNYTDSDCTTFSHTDSCTYNGFCELNPTTGVVSTGGSTVCGGATQSTGCVSAVASCGATVTQTSIVRARVPTIACCLVSGFFNKAMSDSLTETLSNEYTEGAALTKAMIGKTWSPWGEVGEVGCCSAWEPRVAGFSFYYQEAEYRLTVNGGKATTINVKVRILRRPYGVGDYALYLEDTFAIATNSDGVGQMELRVDVTRGYETCVASASIVS